MPLLEVDELHAQYAFAPVLRGVSFGVSAGEIVSIFGRNGAGKTTTLRTIMGWLRPSAGAIRFEGEAIGGLSPDRIFRKGIAFIPEDRRIFGTLTVQENLTLGLFSLWQSSAERRRQIDRVIHLFPRLGERRSQPGKTLSGGEQQMLAIGRALMGNPRVLLMDEPSEGLAPQLVAEVGRTIAQLKSEGQSIVLVEQNIKLALDLADEIVIINTGRVVFRGAADKLKVDDAIVSQHLGVF